MRVLGLGWCECERGGARKKGELELGLYGIGNVAIIVIAIALLILLDPAVSANCVTPTSSGRIVKAEVAVDPALVVVHAARRELSGRYAQNGVHDKT